MNVGQASELRKRLTMVDAQFHVVKNSLFKRVVAGFKWESVDSFIQGPCAVVIGRGDFADAVKLLMEFKKEYQLSVVKCGVCEGETFSSNDLDILAKLPSRHVLYGMLAGTTAAPMVQFVGVMKEKVASLLYVLNAVQQKKSQS